MKQIYRLFVAAIALLVVTIVLGSAVLSKPVNAQQGTPSATSTDSAASELPVDATPLTLDTPITATLDTHTSIQFYTFTGKAQQTLRVDLEPKSGDFFTTLTIMTTDLQTIFGGTLGGNLIGGSLVVRLPADGSYAISVEYELDERYHAANGSYQLTLSAFTKK